MSRQELQKIKSWENWGINGWASQQPIELGFD